MSLGRSVPWHSWEEWREVGSGLLSQDPSAVERGLERVAAWRARGRVPLGVDITACFVQARLADAGLGVPSCGPFAAPSTAAAAAAAAAEPALRLQYSMVVVRMVNGIADSAQRGRLAASVASLASQVGLPRLLVDLRHEATHNELPSLAALRSAAAQALAWLGEQYWQRQGAHLEAGLGRVAELVQEYVALHVAAAAKAGTSRSSDDGDALSDEDGDQEHAPVQAASQPAPAGSEVRYQKDEARRRRRLLLAELRSQVPRPSAMLLVPPLLLAGSPAPGPAPKGASQLLHGLPAAVGRPAAGDKGLALALGHLCRDWPHLPAMLLLAALQELAATLAVPAAAAGAAGSRQPSSAAQHGAAADGVAGTSVGRGGTRVAHLVGWVQRLLPGGPGGMSAGGGAPAGISWRPTAAHARQLLAAALPAYAAAVQHACLAALVLQAGSTAGAIGATTTAPLDVSGAGSAREALLAAIQQLLSLLRGAGIGTSSSLASKCSELLTAYQALGLGQPGCDRSSAAAVAEASVEDAEADASAPRAAEAGRPRETAAQPGQKRALTRDGQTAHTHAAGGKRWRRAEGWASCAIGMLPSACDPNGQLPQLDLAVPLAEVGPSPYAGGPGAAGTVRTLTSTAPAPAEALVAAQQIATAARMPVEAAREGQCYGEEQEGVPWPAADRFTALLAPNDEVPVGMGTESFLAPQLLLSQPAASQAPVRLLV